MNRFLVLTLALVLATAGLLQADDKSQSTVVGSLDPIDVCLLVSKGGMARPAIELRVASDQVSRKSTLEGRQNSCRPVTVRPTAPWQSLGHGGVGR